MKRALQWMRRARAEDWLRLARRLSLHVAIVISGMLIVFFLIDRVNKPMGFMTNEFHKVITFLLSLLSIAFAVRLMAIERRAEREAYRRRQRQTPPRRTAPGETSYRRADAPRAPRRR